MASRNRPGEPSASVSPSTTRPRDAAGHRDGELLPLPLTDAERIEYQKAAERCGLSLTAWIRARLHEAAKREAKEA
jgi:hypothetical protein